MTKEFSAEGLELSGGEKQKLALARLFLSPKRILIMDELSSALDPISEYNILNVFLRTFRTKLLYLSLTGFMWLGFLIK